MSVNIAPENITGFWRAAGPERWFKKDSAFDQDIRTHFLAAHEDAAAGRHADWEKSLDGALALLLLLDQFPRNMFRGDARSFATDGAALSVAKRAIGRGHDARAEKDLRQFFYLPFMHAENLIEQERGIALYKNAGDANGRKWAEMHADVIRRFGRFPHRNALLGRVTTAEEQAFLDSGGFAG